MYKRQVLRAAADLRRVGLPNPLLRSTIEIAAPGYLGHLNSRPTASSLTQGLAEATFDATNDDVVTGARDHDNYRRGTPALAQAGTACFGGASIETYLLHDYLLEDHLARWQETATVPALWRAVLAHSQQVDDLPLAQVLSRNARRHGLLTTALALIEPWISSSSDARGSYIRLALFRGGLSESEIVEMLSWGHSIEERRLIAQRVLQHGYPGGLHKLERLADAGDQPSAQALARLLAARGAATDLAALKRRSEDGDSAAQRQLLRVSAAGMAPEAIETLRTLASGGDESATERLYYLLAKRAGPNDIAELSRCALGGDIRARNRLNETLASEGSAEALAQVRSVATSGGAPDRRRLARVLARRGDESSIQELRERADAGDGSAQHHLARWLVSRGGHQELDELRRRGRGPDASARALYLDVLYRTRDVGGLKERVHAGDRQAASRLLSVYRHSNPAVRELDTEANPVTEVSGPALPASPRRMDS